MQYLLILILALSTFASARPAGKIIAEIPEASGIDYCRDSHTLIVVNDEGYYYELDTDGKILKKIKLGNYDLEGVVCEDEEMIFAIENRGLMIVDRKMKYKKMINLDLRYDGKELPLFKKKSGIEGLAKRDDILYLSKQSSKKKKSFIAVVQLMPLESKIIDMIEHRVSDTSGLSYYEGHLYMVSDREDMLVVYDLQKKEKIGRIKLGKGAWEGIAFDNKGFVYLADDEGKVIKFKKKGLGL